jgi:hypothetical protein
MELHKMQLSWNIKNVQCAEFKGMNCVFIYKYQDPEASSKYCSRVIQGFNNASNHLIWMETVPVAYHLHNQSYKVHQILFFCGTAA